jgi:hypothetical protein
MGNNFENQMSISLNSNEEISFDVTPISHITNISKSHKNKSKLYSKRGAVPNTKLVFSESQPYKLISPKPSSFASISPLSSNQNPAIMDSNAAPNFPEKYFSHYASNRAFVKSKNNER